MSTVQINTEIVDGNTVSRVTVLREGAKGNVVTLTALEGGKYAFSASKEGGNPEQIRLKRAGSDLLLILEGKGPVLYALMIADFYINGGRSASDALSGEPDKNAVSFIAAEEDTGNGIRYLSQGDLTQCPRPTLLGMAPADAQVFIYDEDVMLGTTLVGSGGLWRFTPDIDLTECLHTFTASIITPDGPCFTKEAFTLFIESPLVMQPVIIHSVDSMPPTTDDMTGERPVDCIFPVLYGTAEPRSKIYMFYRQTEGVWILSPDAISVNGAGEWRWAGPPLPSDVAWEFRAGVVHDDALKP